MVSVLSARLAPGGHVSPRNTPEGRDFYGAKALSCTLRSRASGRGWYPSHPREMVLALKRIEAHYQLEGFSQ